MKFSQLFLVIIFILLTTSCGDNEELENRFATKESISSATISRDEIKEEVKHIRSIMDGQSEELSRLISRMDSASRLLEKFSSDHKYIEELKSLDLAQINLLREELAQFKKIQEINHKKKVNSKKRAAKVRKNRAVDFSLEHINTWGNRFVAVLHFPNKGYKTLSENASLGNGWAISNIAKGEVSIVHKSGIRRSLKL